VFFVFNSCSNDYKQTVATFNNLVIADEFSVMELPIVRCGDMILEQEVMVGQWRITIYELNRKCMTLENVN
jgi:hypothetical protein